MGKRKYNQHAHNACYDSPPETLEESLFYGLAMDEQQKIFRDAIWSKNKLVVFCDAKSGMGKTTIAAATANLLVQYRRYDGIVYIMAPAQEEKQGYLPGTLEEKSAPYFEGFIQALATIGVNLNTALSSDILNLKNGTAYINCVTHTFLRGVNFENQVVIIDEAQNFTVAELQKVLTRIHDSCKVVVIGHHMQCDMRNKGDSGFSKYLEHFCGDERVEVCELTKNYRGWISSHADRVNEK